MTTFLNPETSMPTTPPQPLVQTFVVCRDMWQIAGRNEVVLIGPFANITSVAFPIQVPAGAYAHLTDAHGKYEIGLEMRDANDAVAWRWPMTMPINETDPLQPARLMMGGLAIDFPKPGRFDLVLTANGQAVGRYTIWALQAGR